MQCIPIMTSFNNSLRDGKCAYCGELRPLSLHLHELGLACEYLGNTVVYVDGESKRDVRSTTVADWLKLASQLEVVKVDAWKFEHDSFCCGTVAHRVSSDSEHYSIYATALTRFIFVTSALEETYRFVDGHFKAFADANAIPEKSRPRSCSIKAALLVDAIPEKKWPMHLAHLVQNFRSLFERYRLTQNGELSGMQFTDVRKPSYAMHLVRNLRNHVAHGVFPLIPNPDYTWGDEIDHRALLQLLKHACRLSALYIQMLMERFNTGFLSSGYKYCEGDTDPEFEYFIANCNADYILRLHLRGSFSLSGAFDYGTRPWEKNAVSDPPSP